VARQKKTVEGEMDTKIAEPVQRHIYLSNPIFWAYGIFFTLVLFITFFL
jgi:hypothetical protein